VPATPPGRYQKAYERFLEEVNCGLQSLAPFNNNAIDCMRGVSSDVMLDAVTKTRDDGYHVSTAAEIPWFPVQDGDFHRLSPTKAMKTSKVAKVPTIIGEQCVSSRLKLKMTNTTISTDWFQGTTLDEGTLFAERDVDSDDMLKSTIDRASSFLSPIDVHSSYETLTHHRHFPKQEDGGFSSPTRVQKPWTDF
jgi:hypothetical protein